RSLAWTSDMQGRWATDLVGRKDFPRLAAQMIGWLLPTPGSSRLALNTQANGDQLILTAEAQDDTGHPAAGLHVTGELLANDGGVRLVTLREVTPGSYSVALDATPGTYQVQLVATQAEGQPFAAASGGAVIPRGSEYQRAVGDGGLLASLASITGGRVNPSPA